MRRFGLFATFLGLAALTAFASNRIEIARARPYDIELIPSASVLRVGALGHPTLVANLQWLRAVQYIGEPRANERGWDRLYTLVDVITDLDPRHGYAYQVAGTILGSVGRIDESNAIFEKGMRNVPDRYILPFLRAFNAFYYDGDFEAAGRFAEIAAETPNAPKHLRQNVLAYYVKGRRADAAIAFLQEAERETRDEDSRRAIEKQLRQAFLERDAAVLDSAIEVYRSRYGVTPAILAQLVAERLVEAIPDDPFGGMYVIGADGRVRSSVHSYRVGRPGLGRDVRREPGIDNSGKSLKMRVQ